MNARTSKAVRREALISSADQLVELDVARTKAFEAFEEQLEAALAELEERFSDFVTKHSFAGSIGR